MRNNSIKKLLVNKHAQTNLTCWIDEACVLIHSFTEESKHEKLNKLQDID